MNSLKDKHNNSNVSETPSDISDITSPLLDKHIFSDQEFYEEKKENNLLKKLIKPSVTSMNDLLNFESGDEECEEGEISNSLANDSDPVTDLSSCVALEDDTTIDEVVEDMVVYKPNVAEMHSVLEEELNQSWPSMTETTEAIVENLSLEEVGHIR